MNSHGKRFTPHAPTEHTNGSVISTTLEELQALYPRCLNTSASDAYTRKQAINRWYSVKRGHWTYAAVVDGTERNLQPLVDRGLQVIRESLSNSGKTVGIRFTVIIDEDPIAYLLAAWAKADTEAARRREDQIRAAKERDKAYFERKALAAAAVEKLGLVERDGHVFDSEGRWVAGWNIYATPPWWCGSVTMPRRFCAAPEEFTRALESTRPK